MASARPTKTTNNKQGRGLKSAPFLFPTTKLVALFRAPTDLVILERSEEPLYLLLRLQLHFFLSFPLGICFTPSPLFFWLSSRRDLLLASVVASEIGMGFSPYNWAANK